MALGAAVLAGATGGLGAWPRGSTGEAFDGGSPARPEQRGTTASQQTAGQPTAQRGGTPPRPPAVEELLPPLRWTWWRDAEVQKAVGLSAAQVERLDAIVREREHEMAAFIKEHGKRSDDLRRMAAERTVSTEEFAIHVASYQALTSKLNDSRMVMLYRMSRELSDVQYKKLQEYRDKRSAGRGRGNSPNR